MLAKAAQRGADLLILDLEDAVPMAAKADAREAVLEAMPELQGTAPVPGCASTAFPPKGTPISPPSKA